MTLGPPPTVVELVKELNADRIWKQWIRSLYDMLMMEDWHEIGGSDEPAFQNSWANEGTAGNETAAFKLDGLGNLHLKGYIDSGTITDGTAIFTLPVGYRPTSIIRIAGMYVQGSAENAYQIEIQTDGDVAIYGVSGAGPILSLHCIVSLNNG